MATLDSCPSELCQRIFQFACTDDGTTGRALSLVSKYIHSSSKPYKLQSIVISGADQATRFAPVLQRTPDQYRRVSDLTIINDLTVHALPATNDGQLSSSSSLSPSPFIRATTKAVEVIPGVKWYQKYKRLKQGVDHNNLCMQTNRHRDEAIFIASLQILHLTSPTLQTLHMNFQSRWKIIPAHLDVGTSAWRIRSMPMLRELTVQYYALFHAEVDESLFLDDEDKQGETALFPALKYLDLAGLRIRSHPFDLYQQISKVAPALTHLRLPMRMAGGLEGALGFGVGVTPGQGAEDGELALTEERATATPDTTSPSNTSIEPSIPTPFPPTVTPNQLLPATLQRVYIQPPPAPEQHCCNNNLAVHLSKMDEMRAIESRDERVVVLDCTMEKWRMEDIIRWCEWERGWTMNYE